MCAPTFFVALTAYWTSVSDEGQLEDTRILRGGGS